MNFFTPIVDFFAQTPPVLFIQEHLFWFKLVSVVVSAFFLWGIIYSIIGAQYVTQEIDRLYDYFNIKSLPKRRAIHAWRKIQKRLASGTETNLKLAILEADKIFDEILKLSGCAGETMDERIEQAGEQITNLEKLKEAHATAKHITRDPEFTVDEDMARDILKAYEDLFREFGLVGK